MRHNKKTRGMYKLHIILILLIVNNLIALASTTSLAEESNLADSTKLQKEKVLTAVEQMPEFPGGEKALMDFLSRNINYPQRAMENGIQGRVIVQFVVTKNGTVGEVKVLNKVYPDLDNEAIRLCKSLPKFIPGKMNGQPVNVWYTMPITFKLQGLDNSSDNTSQIQETNNLIVKAFGDKTNNPVSINSLAIVEDDIVTSVDMFPEFPGGNAALMKFLSHNINYPQEAMENGIQGKVVVQFIVKKDGTIGTVKVVKSVHPLLDEEAKRLVKMLPKFEPAYRDEKPVNTWYTLPVTFKLQGLAKEPKKPKLFTVLTEVDKYPQFIGGEETLRLFYGNFRFPETAFIKTKKGKRLRNFQGQIDAHFLIKDDGTVGDIKIVKSIHHSVDEEFKRMIKKFLFEPGIKDGKTIDTWCSISCYFKEKK